MTSDKGLDKDCLGIARPDSTNTFGAWLVTELTTGIVNCEFYAY